MPTGSAPANERGDCLVGPGRETDAGSVLFVGQQIDLVRAVAHMPVARDLKRCSILGLVTRIGGPTPPDTVVSLAIAADFDCIDLALLLSHTGYRGRYRVVAHGLPRPALIRRELAQICTALDFDVVAPGHPATGRRDVQTD